MTQNGGYVLYMQLQCRKLPKLGLEVGQFNVREKRETKDSVGPTLCETNKVEN